MRPNLLFAAFFLWASASSAQMTHPVFSACGTGAGMTLHPDLQREQVRIEEQLYQAALKSRSSSAADGLQGLATLPVVVHIIHNGGPENISDAQVQQGINHLNAAFSAQVGTGVNTGIQFCLAQRTPQGQATTGITRDVSPLTTMTMETEDLALKELHRWSPKCYINIWLVSAVNSLSSGSGVAGYAYFPSAHGSDIDGIVMEAAYFGASQQNSAVLIHEMGHYLGLYHTFEGGCANGNCLINGDRVCDTPPDQTTFSACGPNANSCDTDADDTSPNNPFLTDVPDMGENYMDYSSLVCYSRLTQGQSDRMNWHIEHVRSSLLSCLSCQSPCPAPVTAEILLPAGPVHSILVGSTLNLSATAGNANSFSWQLGAGSPFATGLSSSLNFPNVGTYWVIFRASGANQALCPDALDSLKVLVECSAGAAFLSSNTQPDANTVVTFTNQSANATAYQWLLNGVPVANSTDYAHTFTADGVYLVQLIASNAFCADTLAQYIYVGCLDESRRANNWYFGFNAGISFANGSPVALNDGAINTAEGVSSISDRQGNLLFYSDGFRVWNRNHLVMPNGSGLYGSPISAQSSIIVPAPGNPDRYYLFTVPNWTDNATRLSYSIVDMTLNGGLGDIVPATKNTVVNNQVAEQVTAAYHSNCEDIWILTHERNNNRYLAYRLSAAGLDPVPVVSATGNVYDGANRYGGLRVSHNGKMLCSTLGGASTDGITVTLTQFDASTGQVSNPLALEDVTTLPDAYSAEFSPDDRVLYAVAFNTVALRQYDLSSPNIAATIQNIPTGGYLVNVLQMGPDGKIYSGGNGSPVLGRIQNPNALGPACSFVPDAVDLGARYCRIGLPNFFAQYFQPAPGIEAVDSICQSDSTLLRLSYFSCKASYEWSVSPDMGTLKVFSDSLVQFASNGTAGSARVRVVRISACARDTAFADIYVKNCDVCPKMVLDAGPDTTICLGNSVTLQATPGFESYHWTPAAGLDDPNLAHPVATPAVTTTYYLEAQKAGNEMVLNGGFSQGNTGFSSEYVFGGADVGRYWVVPNPVSLNPQWNITNDHSPSADGLMLVIDGDVTGATPKCWEQTLSLPPNMDFTLKFWVAMAYHAEPPNLRVEINGVPAGSFTPLSGPVNAWIWQPFQLDFNSGVAGATTIVLRDLNTAYVGNDFAIDDISVRANCFYTDSLRIELRQASPKLLDLGPDITMCINAVRQLDAGAGFAEYRWQDGSTDQTYTAYGPGIYWVTVKDSCQMEQSDTLRIQPGSIPTLDLGPDRSLCAGDSTQLQYQSNGAFTTFNWAKPDGLSCSQCAGPWAKPAQSTTYYLVATSADGCTNRDSLRVIVQAAAVSSSSITQCKPLVFNGQTYSISGTYRDTLQTSSGCDSIVEIQLTIQPALVSNNSASICAGSSLTVGLHQYSSSGTYRDTLSTASGCDSILITQLTVLPAATNQQTRTLCYGEQLAVGNHTYSSTGTYRDTLSTALGCDSLVTTYLTVLPAILTQTTASICAGGSFSIAGHTYTAAGTYRDTLLSGMGCDSVLLTQLSVLPPANSLQHPKICQGDSFSVGLHQYSSSGTYLDTLQTPAGCDSVVTTQLSVVPQAQFSQALSICAGDSLTVGASVYYSSGLYTETLQSWQGCDSMVTTQLSVLPLLTGMQSIQRCQGDSVRIAQHVYFASGTYVDTLQAAGGCDSILTTQLTILPAWSVFNLKVICAGDTIRVGNNAYVSAGNFTDTLQSTAGCDSLVFTSLSVLPAPVVQNPQVICAGESVQVGAVSYATAGTYHDTLRTVSGCDSVIVTTLSVRPVSQLSIHPVLCSGSSLTVGVHTYHTTGLYRDTLSNSLGCDSIIITQLTVVPEIHTEQTLRICAGDAVSVGSHTYTMAGVYVDTLPAAGGCDSIIHTILEVYPAYTQEQDLVLCMGEQVSIGNHIYSSPGLYRDSLSTVSGCDSILISSIEVLDTTLLRQTFRLCEGEQVQVGNQVYSDPGTYTDLFSNAQGCDSVVLTQIVRGGTEYCDSLNCPVYIPNAFSLQATGPNSVFAVFTGVSEILSMHIYDRWGELMYRSEGNPIQWDGRFRGKAVNPGVYVYVIQGRCAGGKAFTRYGDVTVIR